ncbi:MAG: BRO family protein [Prolixibacteraceae bacterium]
MNEIIIFSDKQFGEIRTATTDAGDPLFCLADVAKSLGYLRPADAVTAHCKGVSILPTPSNGGIQQIKFGKEAEVFRLVMKSKLPDAEKFQDWVCEEILPSIRKSGGYIMTKEEDSVEIIMARALFVAQEAMDRQKAKITALEKEKENVQKVLEHQAPIVQYANEVLSSKSYHTVTTIGAQFGISGTTLNRLLVKAKFIRNTEGEYSLCAPYFGKDYTVTKTFKYENEETGERGTSMELRYTEQGRMKIHSIIERAKTVGLLKTVRGRLMIDKTWEKTESHA